MKNQWRHLRKYVARLHLNKGFKYVTLSMAFLIGVLSYFGIVLTLNYIMAEDLGCSNLQEAEGNVSIIVSSQKVSIVPPSIKVTFFPIDTFGNPLWDQGQCLFSAKLRSELCFFAICQKSNQERKSVKHSVLPGKYLVVAKEVISKTYFEKTISVEKSDMDILIEFTRGTFFYPFDIISIVEKKPGTYWFI